MTKVEPPKGAITKPPKPISRLAELVRPKRIVTAGEAFERDLTGQNDPAGQGTVLPASQQVGAASMPAKQPASVETRFETRRKEPAINSGMPIKRTFRYPKALDSQLRKLVHKYNLEKPDDEPKATTEEVGVIMAKHFLVSDPLGILRKYRGQ